MKILHLSDTHLGAWLTVRGAPPGWSRAADHQAAFEVALLPALREQVDLVVHTGDVFDRSRPPSRWVQRAAATLRDVARRVPVIVLRGNHDQRGVADNLPRDVPDLHVIDQAAVLRFGDLALAAVPYLRTAAAWSQVAGRVCAGGVDALLCHQAFHGSTVPGFTFRVGRQPDTIGIEHLPVGVKRVLCGHIHPRQQLHVGSATVVHPGSTARTSLGEGATQKGVARWTFNGEVTWRFEIVADRGWCRVDRTSELHRVQPDMLVRVPRGMTDLERSVLARGGWLTGRGGPLPSRTTSRQRSEQLRLF